MTKIFDTPVVPISWGELVDKTTILEIKKLKSLNDKYEKYRKL